MHANAYNAHTVKNHKAELANNLRDTSDSVARFFSRPY